MQYGRECEGTVRALVGRGEENHEISSPDDRSAEGKIGRGFFVHIGSSWTVRSGIVAGVRGFALLQNIQRGSGAQETPAVLTRG